MKKSCDKTVAPSCSQEAAPRNAKSAYQRHGYCYKHGKYPRKTFWHGCPYCEKEPALTGPKHRLEFDPNITFHFSRRLQPEILFSVEEEVLP